MIVSFRKVLAFTALAIICSAVPASAFSDLEKQQLHEIIRSYLIENPEVLAEAQAALEAKEQLAQKDAVKQTIASMSDDLYSADNSLVFGNPDADVTIVEFFDYNCGYCKRAMANMQEVVRLDQNVKFILKEFPILGPASTEAARVSLAVTRVAPDKAGAFHTSLLSINGRANGKTALSVAQELGIDVSLVQAEMQAPDLMDSVRTSYQLAQGLGINGTPSYVMGREAIYGAVGVDDIMNRITNLRNCGETAC